MDTAREQRLPQIVDIQAAVCAAFGVSRVDLISDRRQARLVVARHAAMWLARTYTPYSLPAIGQAFGRRDHTTVMHAVARIEERLATDPALAARVSALASEIEGRAEADARVVEAARPASWPV